MTENQNPWQMVDAWDQGAWCLAALALASDGRGETPLTVAAGQVLAAVGLVDEAGASVLCEELRTQAVALHLPDGGRIELDIPSSVDVLGLDPRRHAVTLDRTKPAVRELMLSFPGYWLDNDDLDCTLQGLLRAGVLRPVDLAGPCHAVLTVPSAARIRPDDRASLEAVASSAGDAAGRVVHVLSRPRFAKHLIPLLAAPAVAERVLTDVGDGPYSTLLEPHNFRASALRLLAAAQRLYYPALVATT